jgi:hypothetical protein
MMKYLASLFFMHGTAEHIPCRQTSQGIPTRHRSHTGIAHQRRRHAPFRHGTHAL